MHIFDYKTKPQLCLTPEIVSMIASIHEFRGRQDLFFEANMDALHSLLNVAKIQSTGASNRMEGIFTSDKRLMEIVQKKAEPINRSEQEIAGYMEVLGIIHENYDYIEVRSNVILQLHRDLYSYSKTLVGGNFKNADNLITEVNENGKASTRFVPTPAFQTAEAVENLCEEFQLAHNRNEIDDLILIPMFVFDFLCIHPFNDGNGRMSRLLTLLLLYKARYTVGKYISIEMLIESTKLTYYEALQASSEGWHDNNNDYSPFVKYYLGILLKAYKEFESRVEHLKYQRISKSDRIKKLFDSNIGKITKRGIMERCPDISKVTVERTLIHLVKTGYIRKIGAGRSTTYVKA